MRAITASSRHKGTKIAIRRSDLRFNWSGAGKGKGLRGSSATQVMNRSSKPLNRIQIAAGIRIRTTQ